MTIQLNVTQEITALWQAIQAGRVSYSSYINLQAAVSRPLGSIAEVVGDTGNHEDPVINQNVPNEGVYRRAVQGWQWISPLPEDFVQAAIDAVQGYGLGLYYATIAEGVAATAVGEVFSSDEGHVGEMSVYRRTSVDPFWELVANLGGGDTTISGGVRTPRRHAMFIGSITGDTLTVPKDFELHLTPRGSFGVPEVGMKLTTIMTLVPPLPDDLEIESVTTAYVPETAVDTGGTTGVYKLNQSLDTPTPAVVYFQGYKEVEIQPYGLTQVGPTQVSLESYGVTGLNDASDSQKVLDFFENAPLGGKLHLPAGQFYVDETINIRGDMHLTAEPGTRLSLRTAAGNYIPLFAVDPRYRQIGEANTSRGLRFEGNGAILDIVNTSAGGDADTYDVDGNATLRKAGSYVFDVNADWEDGGHSIQRMIIDGWRMTGGNKGAVHFIGGGQGEPETYWSQVRDCPAIEGAIVDSGSDGNAVIGCNFVGSYQAANIVNKQQGALNQYYAHNTSACKNGFFTGLNISKVLFFDNQLEHAGEELNANDAGAQVAILAQDYPTLKATFLSNNFGKGQYDTTGVALLGEVVQAIFDDNTWMLYTQDTTQRYDLTIGHSDVREIIWRSSNVLKGNRMVDAAGTTGLPNRQPRGTFTDMYQRLLQISLIGTATLNNLKAHTGLCIPITGQTTLLNGTTIPVTGLEVARGEDGIWEAWADLATVHATNDVLTLPEFCRPIFEQWIHLVCNGIITPRRLTTTGTIAGSAGGGVAFGAAAVSMDGARWRGVGHRDHVIEF